MANTITCNPLILQSAATNIITGEFRITKIAWDNSGGDIAPGDQVVLKDKNSNVVYQKTIHDIGTMTNCLVEPQDRDFIPPLPCNGLTITTLSHGTVFVYYEGPVPLKTT